MRNCYFLAGLMAITVLSGCTSVYFHHPIGETITEEPEEVSSRFDGTWANEDGETAQFKYLGDGKLRLAMLRWDSEIKSFNKEGGTVLLTTHRSTTYMNMADEDADDDRCMFARYTFASERTLILWTPRTEAFEKAVRSGTLKGTVERVERSTTIDVTAEKEQIDDFIDPMEFAEQFDVEIPIVLTRLTD